MTNKPRNQFRLAVVGHGFVGQAVAYAFTHPLVSFFAVDPKYNTSIDDLKGFKPHIVFVCAPTPEGEDGSVDATIVIDAVQKALIHTQALVVVKSTVTPDIIDRIYVSMDKTHIDRFVYNPEFLTESNAKSDFVNADYHVFGGSENATHELSDIYDIFSGCSSNDYHYMTAFEASFVKYTINAYLSTKVTFFNQIYDLINLYGCSYNIISRTVGLDPRVGIGHTRVPGFDKKRGFGGACLPKDTKALLKFSESTDKDGNLVSMDILERVLDINTRYRKNYELDEREKVNNITFVNFGGTNEHNEQAKKEQQTEGNGDIVEE